jgi:predicted PurR-regulated permease PerM
METPHWSYVTRIVVTIICILAGITLLFLALPLVQALIIAGLLAYLLNPLVGNLMRRFRFRRPLAAVLIFSLLLVILISLPAMLGTLLYGLVVRLGNNLLQVLSDVEAHLSQPIFLFGFDLSPRTLLTNLGQSFGGTLAALPRGSFNVLSGITTNLLWGLVILVSLYYFLKDGPKIRPWLMSLCPPGYEGEVGHLLDELDTVWSLFLRVQLLIFLILAIVFILGVLVLIWLYQHGLIPFSTLGFILLVILLLFLVQQLDNLWLRPQLLGHQLRLHPGLVFVGLIGALALSGVLGALIVVPLMASIKVIGYYVRCKLLDQTPWLEDASS